MCVCVWGGWDDRDRRTETEKGNKVMALGRGWDKATVYGKNKNAAEQI